MPQKLTTTACFIQEESSGGKQFRKHVSCFYAQGGNVGGGVVIKIACIPFFVYTDIFIMFIPFIASGLFQYRFLVD